MRKQGRTGNHLGNCRVRPPRKSFDIPSSTVLRQSGNFAVSTGSWFLFLFTLMVTYHFCWLSPPLMLLTPCFQCFQFTTSQSDGWVQPVTIQRAGSQPGKALPVDPSGPAALGADITRSSVTMYWALAMCLTLF